MSKYVVQDLPATREEWLVNLYLEELKDNGWIKKIIFQPKPFTLFKGLPKKFFRDKQLKTKVKRVFSKKQYLLNPHVYTADFEVWWEEVDSLDIFQRHVDSTEIDLSIPFISSFGGVCSYLEVKPSFDQNGKTQMFRSYVQPQIWDKHEVYVQIIKPFILFEHSFIPEQAMSEMFYKKDVYTGKGKNRKLKASKGDPKYKWEYKTLKEYLYENK